MLASRHNKNIIVKALCNLVKSFNSSEPLLLCCALYDKLNLLLISPLLKIPPEPKVCGDDYVEAKGSYLLVYIVLLPRDRKGFALILVIDQSLVA